uniref:Elongation factor Ts n=1 Tax=Desulfobacca acetoxidans TaxID=60893 RepID=A0A7C5ELW7_9BACT
MVKQLREKTNCGFMDCKKALQETQGDLEAAVAYLRQKGIAVATKRAERATSEGAVWSYLGPEGTSGVLLEVNCESDFVAKTEAFQAFGAALAAQLAQDAVADVETLLSQPWRGQPGLTVQEYLNELIGQIGENIRIRRFSRFAGQGPVAAYIHFGGKIGVLLELKAPRVSEDLKSLARDLAMQVAATNPLAISREELDPAVVAQEKAVYEAQARESGKPEKILEKMVHGRLEKFYKEVCLIEQPFVKNPDLTVSQLLNEAGTREGGQITVSRFVRYQVGA